MALLMNCSRMTGKSSCCLPYSGAVAVLGFFVWGGYWGGGFLFGGCDGGWFFCWGGDKGNKAPKARNCDCRRQEASAEKISDLCISQKISSISKKFLMTFFFFFFFFLIFFFFYL